MIFKTDGLKRIATKLAGKSLGTGGQKFSLIQFSIQFNFI